MQLSRMKGLGPATRQKLQAAGIKTVEQLALVDTRTRKVKGVAPDRLLSLRKEAQKTIFKQAAQRVATAAQATRTAAAKGAQELENAARDAAERIVASVKEAEAYAAEALKHAEALAAGLAKDAATRASAARENARKQAVSLRRKIGKARRGPTLQRYIRAIDRAEKAGQTAAEKAWNAAQKASEATQEAAKTAGTKGRGLYQRLVAKMGGRKRRP